MDEMFILTLLEQYEGHDTVAVSTSYEALVELAQSRWPGEYDPFVKREDHESWEALKVGHREKCNSSVTYGNCPSLVIGKVDVAKIGDVAVYETVTDSPSLAGDICVDSHGEEWPEHTDTTECLRCGAELLDEFDDDEMAG